ncbi:hypothetical protein [Pseudoduganella umbonata]|uniref:Uncharacterized protein n=1 Tax=Pseudoduganella umbonata TaxID=864828 RepID=A0A4P8HY89_9BURK|nr:hypothetical protein [Pseudoduganella umbonata]MBB3223139.1 hypothetical protein [Pseudoduganella umbonata]QCP13918.1 hypothetical protein FCL38_28480 [Pseudoduganella umbonata]
MGQAHDVLERARTARLEGRYEDALRDHLWFHENALAVEPGLAGVRLSFALRDWIYLAEQFPLARRALQGLRDRDTARMLDGGQTRELFRDIVAINSALGEERATHDLFVRMDIQMPELARQCADFALPALVAAEDFTLARRYLGDPAKRVQALAANLNAYTAELVKTAGTSSAPALLSFVLNYTKEVRLVVEVLRRQDEEDVAERVSRAALDELKSDALRDAVEREFETPGATIQAMVAHARANVTEH